MSDRLKELQRQRALAQEQLAWFDREIAREAGVTIPALVAAEIKPAAPASSLPTHGSSGFDAAADIIARYNQEPPGDMAKQAKRGCMLYFIFAFIAFGLLLFGVYFYYTQVRPTRETPPSAGSRPEN